MRRGTWVALCALMLMVVCLSFLILAPGAVQAQGSDDALVYDMRILEEGERLNEDVVVLGGTLRALQGSIVQGSIVLAGGQADLAGLVQGDVVSFGGTVQLGPTAEVAGDVVVLGTLRRHGDAVIHGEVIEGLAGTKRLKAVAGNWYSQVTPSAPEGAAPPRPQGETRESGGLLRALRALVSMIGLLLVAAVLATAAPANLANTTEAMRRTAPLSVAAGLLTLILAMLLTPLLIIICIGIPVALVLMLVLFAAGVFAWVAAGRLVGRLILRLLKREGSSLAIETVLGTFLITAAANVDCFGFVLALALVSWGLGAVILTRVGTTIDPFWSPFAAPAGSTSTPPPPPSSAASEAPLSLDGPRDTHKLER